MAASPELEAVALIPIAVGVASVGGLFGGGEGDPIGGDELFAVPLSFLEVELAEFGDVFGADGESITAEGDPFGAIVPGGIFDAERFEESRSEEVDDFLAGLFLDDGRAHVGSGSVVEEVGSWFELDGVGEKFLRPGGFADEPGFGIVSGGHGEEVADAHGLELVGGGLGEVVGEELDDFVFEVEFAFVDREANGGGGEAFAEGVELMFGFGVVGGPPGFGDDFAVTQEHEAMERVDVLIGGLEEVGDGLGGDCL